MEIQTPNWVKHAVFYQIFPDRFAKSQHPKYGLWQSSNLESWDSPPTYQGYKGGDLWGVMEKLDYLKDLGINAIYFTPIFQSASNHRYHTHDYYQVDPMLGGNVAFDVLIEEAHQRNIKVVLDGVFNHASRGFLFFNDILEHGPNSAWVNWFKIQKWPVSAYNGEYPANYVGWADNRALPEFNHENPEVREYIMQVGEYWLKKGIDGWRLDVPFEIKVPGFWEEFRDRVKAINPEAYIIGEIWDDATEWLKGDQFDGVMNYPFAEATIAFVAGDRVLREYYEGQDFSPYPALSAITYGQKMESLLSRYPWDIQLTQLNLFNSHDTARVLTTTGKDKTSIKLITLLMFTYPGAPSIYYGDEVGLEGGKDPDCRRTFPKEEDWDLVALNYHKQIIAIRHQYPALRTGNYKMVYGDDTVYVFARTLDTQTVLVGVNVDNENRNVNFNFEVSDSCPEKLVYGQSEISWDNKQASLTIPGRTGCIFV